jgi:cytidylate kinase
MGDFITIAIDGAAASGKTSTALRVAQKYDMLMASTGSYYRALAVKMINSSVGSGDEAAIGDFLQKITLGTSVSGNITNIAIGGEVIADSELRAQSVNECVAKYSSSPAVREFLVEYQRSQVDIARKGGFNGLVMEGRDITSVILPDADLKFFLSASVVERSRRRENDSESDCVAERDSIDNRRTICNSDVHRIDTGANGIISVVEIISQKIDEIICRKL